MNTICSIQVLPDSSDRVVLIVLFSSIANTNTVAGPQLNLLFPSLSSFALFGLTAVLKPYKHGLLNGLEIFRLTILLIFSSSYFYVSSIGSGIRQSIYIYTILVGICFHVFLGTCVGHVWYRVHKVWTVSLYHKSLSIDQCKHHYHHCVNVWRVSG